MGLAIGAKVGKAVLKAVALDAGRGYLISGCWFLFDLKRGLLFFFFWEDCISVFCIDYL